MPNSCLPSDRLGFRFVLRFLRSLDLIPELILVIKGQIDKIKISGPGKGLHGPEPGQETFGCRIQGRCRLDPLAASELHKREQMVAELVFNGCFIPIGHGIKQFKPFGFNLLFHVFIFRPGEADPIGLGMNAIGLGQRRQATGKRIVRSLGSILGSGLFLALDAIPVLELFRLGSIGGIRKNMGMTPNHLVGLHFQRFGQPRSSGTLHELADKNEQESHVAQLFHDIGCLAGPDGLHEFVALFNNIFRKGLGRLRAVPGTAVRGDESIDNRGKAFQRRKRGGFRAGSLIFHDGSILFRCVDNAIAGKTTEFNPKLPVKKGHSPILPERLGTVQKEKTEAALSNKGSHVSSSSAAVLFTFSVFCRELAENMQEPRNGAPNRPTPGRKRKKGDPACFTLKAKPGRLRLLFSFLKRSAMLANRSTGSLAPAFFSALAGIAFSIWNAWDASSVPCVTAGCTLYQSFSFGGFSLWWAGAGVFTLLALFALTGRAVLGRMLAGCAVLADCLLLGIMLLTLPCLSCMVAAFLLALSYLFFRGAMDSSNYGRRSLSLLLSIWSLLFLGNVACAIRSEMQPWAMQQAQTEENTPIRVFFSPSCSACRQLVTGLSETDAKKISWYPVAEEDKDLAIILNLQQRLALGGNTFAGHFLAAMDTPEPSPWEMLRPSTLLLQFRLWTNKAEVITSGDGRLPFVQFLGVPSALIRSSGVTPANRPTAPSPESFGGQTTIGGTNGNASHTLPIDLGGSGSCGGENNPVPCP